MRGPWYGRLGRHLRRGAGAYAVLLLSLILTGLAWQFARQAVREQNEVRFRETVRATSVAVDRRTDDYLDAMFGARGYLLASDRVERAEWDEYVEGVRSEIRLGGLQALGFAERVEPEEWEDFARETGRDNLPPIAPDLEPGGAREVYFPVRLVAPLDRANSKLFGDDKYPDAVHRAAMEHARDRGTPQATGAIYTHVELSTNETADLALRKGFAVYLPVYEGGGTPDSVAGRRRALEGFVVGYFTKDGLLDDVYGGGFDPAIDFEVYDGENVSTESMLHDEDGTQRAGDTNFDPLFDERQGIEVAGREWSLYFATLRRFDRGAESSLPVFVLATGVAVNLMLFGISWMLVRSRTKAEKASKALEDANRELAGTNRELEAFSYSVSHDLRAPLRTIDGFSHILAEDYADKLDDEGLDYLGRVRAASRHMAELIDDLLDLSRVGRRPLARERVDLSALATGIFNDLRRADPDRDVRFVSEEGVTAEGDVGLLKVALENLLGNAWKFTSGKKRATIRFGVSDGAYFVSDDGAGFEGTYKDKLFGAFQRLHGSEEFEGTGIGLATVARIVHRHGGEVWAEGAVGEGATFFFTLGGRARSTGEAALKKPEFAG